MKKLDTSYNKTLSVTEMDEIAHFVSAIKQQSVTEEDDIFVAVVDYVMNTSVNSDPGTPRTDKEAFNSPEREQWKRGKWSEFDNFMKRHAWKVISRDAVPEGANILRTKNVYKKKTSPTTSEIIYKVRNVILGYMQIPGVDYTESFAPLADDISVKVAFALSLYYTSQYPPGAWVEEMIDVEAAFLNASLPEPVYIEIPSDFEEYAEDRKIDMPNDPVISVGMSQYGLVTSARLWAQTFSKILRDDGKLEQCITDPCVYYKHGANGELELLAVIYCDDALLMGLQQEVQALKAAIRKHVIITELGLPSKHLGIEMERGHDDIGDFWKMSVQKAIDSIIEDVEKQDGKSLKEYSTPAIPGKVLFNNEGEKVNQSEYRSIIGRILYPAKKAIPSIMNAVRDLCRHLDNPGVEHWTALKRLLGYMKGHYKPLLLRSPRELRCHSNTDATWGSDPNDRRSVSGKLVTIDRCLVDFASKKQTGIALSSTDAEMVAGSEGAGTMTFVENLIDEVAGDKARQKPSIMHIDNMGAVHIANNQAVTPRTKHVDIRARYLQQKVRDGSMECKHIPTDKCHADIETKALPEQTYIAHEDAIHNGVFSFVESTEVVVPAGKEDVKLSQVARECRQARPQSPAGSNQ